MADDAVPAGAAAVTGQVIAMFGGDALAAREPSAAAIEVLEDMLERARAGEVQAVGVVAQYWCGGAGYSIGGRLGGYSIIGACAVMMRGLEEVAE